MAGRDWRLTLRKERGDAALYAILATFALLTATYSDISAHRAWGAVAAPGYAIGVLLVGAGYLATRRVGDRARHLARLGALGGVVIMAVLTPMFSLVALRADGVPRTMLGEVRVVEEAAQRLVIFGNPYAGPAELAVAVADHSARAYCPYLPAMTVFGLPRAVGGAMALTDVRLVFALATAVLVGLAFALRRRRFLAPERGGVSVRALQFLGVTPLLALPVATGGDDVPVLALLLLGFALVDRRALGWAGLAVGAAAAMKLTAWPVAGVLALAVLAMYGRRAVLRFVGAVGAVLAVTVVPFAVADPGRLVEHVLRFPFGMTTVRTPAASPLLGYWIERSGPYGHTAAITLLAVVGAGFVGYLLWRPPRSVVAAAVMASAGLTAAFVLAPATRFGYLLYPVVLGAWAALGRSAEASVDDELDTLLREGAEKQALTVAAAAP